MNAEKFNKIAAESAEKIKDNYDAGKCGFCEQKVREGENAFSVTLVMTMNKQNIGMIRTCSAACAINYIRRIDTALKLAQLIPVPH